MIQSKDTIRISIVEQHNLDFVETVDMGFFRKNSIEFHGETHKALCSNREAYAVFIEISTEIQLVIPRSASENLRWRF